MASRCETARQDDAGPTSLRYPRIPPADESPVQSRPGEESNVNAMASEETGDVAAHGSRTDDRDAHRRQAPRLFVSSSRSTASSMNRVTNADCSPGAVCLTIADPTSAAPHQPVVCHRPIESGGGCTLGVGYGPT